MTTHKRLEKRVNTSLTTSIKHDMATDHSVESN